MFINRPGLRRRFEVSRTSRARFSTRFKWGRWYTLFLLLFMLTIFIMIDLNAEIFSLSEMQPIPQQHLDKDTIRPQHLDKDTIRPQHLDKDTIRPQHLDKDNVTRSVLAVTTTMERSSSGLVIALVDTYPPPTTTMKTLLALCPDMRVKDEKPIGQRFGPNDTRFNILGEAWGDPNLKREQLPVWNAKNIEFIKSQTAQDICNNDMTLQPQMKNQTKVNFCPCFNSRMQGNVKLDFSPPSWPEMFATYFTMGVQYGGEWQPTECRARQKIAFIIPYKDRLNHLHVLINHLHKVLVRQDSHYRIFVVEQAHPNIFNKAALMDLGFLEALKLFPFDCVIFHDVDLLLEDDRNVYGCLKNLARHIASHTDKHAYKLPYNSLFGGSTAFTVNNFKDLNGYATTYWGWGGEDDDMYARLRTKKKKPHRQTKALARFTMMRHIRDKNFPPNIYKDKLIKDRKGFLATITKDGLSSIQYVVHGIIKRPLFTWIYAEAKSPLSDFFVKEGVCEEVTVNSYFHDEEVLLHCATRCQQDEKCQLFQFHFNADWHPFCSLFTKNCIEANASNVVSYIYTKGRPVPIPIRA